MNQAVRNLLRFRIKQELNILRAAHDKVANETGKKSATELFFNPKVQELLKKISVADPALVLKIRKQSKHQAPYFEFMSDQDLAKAREAMYKKVDYYMQVPPVLDPKDAEASEVLSVDACLDGHDLDHSKYVFTDISFNLKEQERIIVVREPDGVLRTANENERHRVCEAYYPREGRKMEPHRLFLKNNLESLWQRQEYVFILDSACVQFEPHHPKYQDIVFTTYEKINEMSHFQRLYSTRHLAALAFYLALHDKIDNMVLYNISSGRLEDAISLVRLYHIIHPNCKSKKAVSGDNELDLLESYIKNDSKDWARLNLALKTYLDLERKKIEAAQGIQEAHGA